MSEVFSVSIQEDTAKTLREAAPSRGISGYLSRLCEDAWREWQSALDYLRRTHPSMTPASLKSSLEALHGHTVQHWGLRAALNPSIAAEYKNDDSALQALVTLGREYWRGNRQLIRAVSQDTWK